MEKPGIILNVRIKYTKVGKNEFLSRRQERWWSPVGMLDGYVGI